MAKKYLGDYSDKDLARLSPAYANRIRRAREKYGPDASITWARGHRPSQSARAQRLRQPVERRYSPEYLESLSPKYRRQIEKELRRSERTGQAPDIARATSSPKARARRLYYTWIAQTTMVQGTAFMPYSRAVAVIKDTVAPPFRQGMPADGRTFGEYFEQAWADAKKNKATTYLTTLFETQVQRATDYRNLGSREFRKRYGKLAPTTVQVAADMYGTSYNVQPPAPAPEPQMPPREYDTEIQTVTTYTDENGDVAVVDDRDLLGGQAPFPQQPEPEFELEFDVDEDYFYNMLESDFFNSLPEFFIYYH